MRPCETAPDPTYFDLDGGITTIDCRFQRTGMAASHLIVDDGRAGFVDVGSSRSTPQLLGTLAQKGIAREQVDLVMVTHVHLDHAGGAGVLMRELPNARLVVHPRGAPHMIDPSRLIAGATAIYGPEEMARSYGEIAAVAADRVVVANDGLELSLGQRTLRFVDTPGHARHHYSVVDGITGGIFTGDCFGLSYRDFDTARGPWIFPTTTPIQFDPAAMHATLDKLMALAPPCLYLTHFGQVGDLPRLAANMHRMVDEVVAIALAQRDDGEQRHAALVADLNRYYLDELRRHGCTLDQHTIADVLSIDVELNAQGLEVWLDHSARPRA